MTRPATRDVLIGADPIWAEFGVGFINQAARQGYSEPRGPGEALCHHYSSCHLPEPCLQTRWPRPENVGTIVGGKLSAPHDGPGREIGRQDHKAQEPSCRAMRLAAGGESSTDSSR